MKKLKHYIFALIAVSSIVACEPEPLDISVPQTDPKLVVYTQVLPDQALIVALSKSFSALSTPNETEDSTKQDSVNNIFLNQFLVDNATITIEGTNYNDTLVRATKGVYIAPLFPFTPGNTYELKAHDPATGFSVSAFATTLPIVRFDSISAKRQKNDDSLFVDIKYKVADPAGDNYYLVNVYTDSIPESNFFSFTGESNTNSIAFSDQEFPAGELVRDDEFEVTNRDTLIVTLTNISKDYFDFIKARERSGNSFLSEPVVYPSNITNGLGYFNIHFPSSATLIVK